MAIPRLEVQWSPVHRDRFITWGAELCLYETLNKLPENRDGSIDISDKTACRLLATNSSHHYIKCVDIYPKEDKDLLLGVGHGNGKVVLTTFCPSKYDTLGLNGLELVPKHLRQCNALQWNRIDNNLMLTGLDKCRGDHCIFVWDIQARHHNTKAEIGLSETANSLSWLSDQSTTLIAGINGKVLRLIDLRDSTKAPLSTNTKAVFGACVPTHPSFFFASYFENQIGIWDMRNFDRPVVTSQQSKTIIKIQWCATRMNILGSLEKDSKSIYLHDIQQMENSEPSVLERCIKPGSNHHITSFSWHPKDENRLLAVNAQGSLVDHTVLERMTLNWSQNCQLVWTVEQRNICVVAHGDELYESIGDLSTVIKKRALQGYGLKSNLKDNALLVDDPQLKMVWKWLDRSKELVEKGLYPHSSNGSNKHPGARTMLGMDGNLYLRSEAQYLPWIGLNTNATAKVYRSDMRDRALALCNWKFVHDADLFETTIDQLESEGHITKAAAMCIFSLQIKRAIKILSETSHHAVSMALSGFTDEKSSIWREFCSASRNKLKDPYLRAIFAFLTSELNNYDLVLNEPGISVTDKIGFALTFLPDSNLVEYISQLSETLANDGNLIGLLLFGMTVHVIPLLQNYLDQTSDVQSVSLIAMRAFPPSLLDHDRALYWINCYRELLDTWTMWSQRAHFDICHNSRSSSRPEPQVFVTCNFCGKSTGIYRSDPRNKAPFQRPKVTSCPNCRKPQPRCSICLIHMGTSSSFQPESSLSTSVQINPFDTWYSWCQACRHGGHAAHMDKWFNEHRECPVTDCSCKCFSLDTIINPYKSSVA